MNLFAAILAVALAAPQAFAAGWSEATQFRNNWAPAIDAASMQEITVPAAAAPVKAGPRDGQNYSGAEELLIMEFGITSISMDIPEHVVISQDRFYSNSFCFEHALRLALNAVLNDYSDAASPLARELKGMGTLQFPTKYDLRKAGKTLLQKMDRGDSHIALVRPYKFDQPPGGELVARNWIFFLRVEGRSYWAVVDRSGEKPAYVYGD